MKLDEYLSDSEHSVAAFAAAVGVTPEAVRQWRKGERFPRFKQLQQIAEFTHGRVMPNDFLPVQIPPAANHDSATRPPEAAE